jgi:DNA processing protein
MSELPSADDREYRVLLPLDPEWPSQVSDLGPAEPPTILHLKGRAIPDPDKCVAIVGTRRPTVTGLEIAKEMAVVLAQAGFSIISGLALGIDAAAHRGALEAGGHTVAVLGCGLDVPYPQRNLSLRKQIMARGTLVSEYPVGTPVWPSHFPARNRIIVGLSCAVIVVEGGLRSGALITARLANDAGRTVFAVPGSPRNAVAIGPNELIRAGATLATGPDHVFQELAPGITWTKPFEPGDRVELGDEELKVLHLLDAVPVTVDELCASSGFLPGKIALTLSQLEIRGLARRTRTGQFEITEPGLRVSLSSA